MNIFQNKPDFVGMLASGLCAVHCAAAPIFFVVQPAVHNAISEADHHSHNHGHGIWSSLDFIFLALSLGAVYFASKASQRISTRTWLWGGWIVFAVGILMEHLGMVGWLMYVGSAILVVTHVVNIRQCQISRNSLV